MCVRRKSPSTFMKRSRIIGRWTVPRTQLERHFDQGTRGCLVPRCCIAQPCAYNARRHVIPRVREYWDTCTLDLRAPLRSLNHRRPPIGKRIRPRLTKSLCKWIHGRHPRSLARLWSPTRYIHAYISREKEKRRKERLRLGLNKYLASQKRFFFIYYKK